MARRSDHSKEQIKEMALDAAQELAAKDGMSGISARKITSAIGYTVGTLYLEFKNLDDLLLHVNARTLDSMYKELKQASEQCQSPTDCILAIGRAYVNFATQNPHQWNMIFEHRLAEDEQAPHWFIQKVDVAFELVEQQLKKLMSNHSSEKITHTSRALWCSVHGICALAVTSKLESSDAAYIQGLTDSLIKYFLAGLTLELKGE